jgi:hypothetical protein
MSEDILPETNPFFHCKTRQLKNIRPSRVSNISLTNTSAQGERQFAGQSRAENFP